MARLEGDVANLKEVVHSLAPLTTQTAVLARNVAELDKDMGAIRDEFRTRVEKLQITMERDYEERRSEARNQAIERKRDRYAAFGAVIAASSLIITATAVLLSVLH